MADRRATFERLYRHGQGPARRAIRKVLFDPALREDALALAFMRLWRKLEAGPVEDPERLLPLLARGCALDLYRRLKARREVETPVGLVPELVAIEEQMYAKGRPLPERLWTFPTEFDIAVREAEADGRHAFILTDLRGLSQVEAGALLGVEHTTVSRRAAEVRTHIRKELF